MSRFLPVLDDFNLDGTGPWSTEMNDRRASRHGRDMAEAISAFVKAAMLDMDYAISVYLETLDDARRRAEEAGREALQQERAVVGESIGAALAKLASQDRTYRLSTEMPDAYRELQADFNAAIEKLEEVMQHVSGTASAIHSGTQEIAAAADDLSQHTEHQAASLEESAVALHEITATVERSAEGATKAREVVAAADEDAKKSAVVVRQAVEAMDAIAKLSQQISQHWRDRRNCVPNQFARAERRGRGGASGRIGPRLCSGGFRSASARSAVSSGGQRDQRTDFDIDDASQPRRQSRGRNRQVIGADCNPGLVRGLKNASGL
jgi:uncharacterized protein YoxC